MSQSREPRWSFGRLTLRIATWFPAIILAFLTANNLYQRFRPDTPFQPLIALLLLLISWIGYSVLLGWSRRLTPFMLMMSIPLANGLIYNFTFDSTKVVIILALLAITLLFVKQLPLWLMTMAISVAVVLSFALSVIDPFAAAYQYKDAALTWTLSLFLLWLAASVPLNFIDQGLRRPESDQSVAPRLKRLS